MINKKLAVGIVSVAITAALTGCQLPGQGGTDVPPETPGFTDEDDPVELYGPAPDFTENENWDTEVFDEEELHLDDQMVVYGPAPDFTENENWDGGNGEE